MNSMINRRSFLKMAGATAALSAMPAVLTACGGAAGSNIKIGLLLPYSDIYAVLGESIEAAMRLYFSKFNDEAGGRTIELIREDTEINPTVAQQKATKLVEQDEVDLVAGIVSSGVLVGLRDYFEETQTLLLCANAGANVLSRALKTPYIWRTSFTNWMAPHAMGGWAAENLGLRGAISVPDYAAGEDNINAFSDSFTKAGGELVLIQRTPFPNMGDPAPFMTELANSEADFFYSFYSGGAAVTFVNAYSDFGLNDQIPLVCAGFMVEQDVLPSQGNAALGIPSTLHWSYMLDNPENQAFIAEYEEETGREPDVFAVQGYDTARVIVEMLNAVEGDTSDVQAMIDVLPGISFDSPRGPFALDAGSQAPTQEIYLREVQEVDGVLRNAVVQSFGSVTDPGDDSMG